MPSDRSIAVCSWSLQPGSPEELVERVRATELTAVQLALSPVVRDPETWGDVFSHLRDAGIAVVSGMMEMADEDYSTLDTIAATGGVRPAATWAANLDHATEVIDIAAGQELELVTFHAGFLPAVGDPERATVLERIGAIAEIAAEAAIVLGLETGQERADDLLVALEELGAANVRVNFDPANMLLYGTGDPIAALNELRAHVAQVHVKDATPSAAPGAWGTEVPAGDGAVPWPAFFEFVDPLGVPYVIERESGDARVDDVRRAHALLTAE